MWRHAIDFWEQAHASGLGQDAVIEIMIALLGVMMAVMAILAAFVTLIFAALGVFGYKSIEERSVKAAEEKAAKVAEEKTELAIAEFRDREQGAALSASQPTTSKKTLSRQGKSSKKTSDSSLTSGDEK